MIRFFGTISWRLWLAVLLYRFWMSEKTLVLSLSAPAVTTGAGRPLPVIDSRTAFDEKNQQEQGKYNYGGCQHENNFRHCPPCSTLLIVVSKRLLN